MKTKKPKPETPSPWEFQQLAEASLDAANAAYEKCQQIDNDFAEGKKDVKSTFMSITTAFLYFRAIELSLKAAILEKELATQDDIPSQKLAHDLKKLIACATTSTTDTPAYSLSDLGLNTEDKAFIERYSDCYNNKWLEYYFGPNNVPCLHESQRVATSLVETIKPFATTQPSLTVLIGRATPP